MNNLYLLNYNEYTNRTIKLEKSLADYEPYLVADVIYNINFIPADGIDTTQIVGATVPVYQEPNYIVVTDLYNNIVSRWFVVQGTRLRNGQYNLTLRRDVIADNLDAVLEADSYIMKAPLRNTDPLIYNPEGMTFNQIKQSETPLKDYTGVPWIVAYISPDVVKDGGKVRADIEAYYDEELADLSDYAYYKWFNKAAINKKRTVFNLNTIPYGGLSRQGKRLSFYFPDRNVTVTNSNADSKAQMPSAYPLETIQELWASFSKSEIAAIQDNIIADTEITENEINQLIRENGKILKVQNQYYRVLLEREENVVLNNPLIGSSGDILFQKVVLDGFLTDLLSNEKVYPEQKAAAQDMYFQGSRYKLTYEEISGETVVFEYDFTNKTVSNPETPFGILCMPYGDVGVRVGYNIENPILSKTARLKIMQALGSIQNLVYDIQLLPYCPISNLIVLDYELSVRDNIVTIPVKQIIGENTEQQTEEYLTSIIVSPRSSFSLTIPSPITITDVKQQNETDIWRLCSPNYAGAFEFNAAKMFTGSNTVIENFHITCNYRPYTPYIKVAPDFAGLYGKNFGDARGLICGGDFSLDRISDNWETYQYNNKNFQLQFDRQIESMELQRNWAIADGIINGVGSAITGGILAGTGIGAVAGIGMAAAGAVDAVYNGVQSAMLSGDSIDAAKDQFNYNLGNIKAQPYGLTKVSALNADNKLFPFIEYYSCTDEEKEVFKKKIQYTGMTVGRIDNISNYLINEENFIKARVIRFKRGLGAADLAVAINNELLAGVFINGD